MMFRCKQQWELEQSDLDCSSEYFNCAELRGSLFVYSLQSFFAVERLLYDLLAVIIYTLHSNFEVPVYPTRDISLRVKLFGKKTENNNPIFTSTNHTEVFILNLSHVF